MVKLLFVDLAERIFTTARVQKLQSWVNNLESARKTGNLDANAYQHDKAEELITFYTFAPLLLSLNRVGLTNRILSLAEISAYEENVPYVGLERQGNSPKGYLKWLKGDVKNHPVKYIREQANKHKPNQPLESNTHVDAFIETDKLLIFFEIKFTSDISHSTTFNPCRNQLARLIDVGLEMNEHNGKEVLVILSTPRKLYESKNRLYYYKIRDYTEPKLIQEDLQWREISKIRDNLLAVRWIALEELVSLLYKDFNHPDKEEAMEFFKVRRLA